MDRPHIGKKSLQGQHLGICVCYLPPISSSRGDISQEFWDDLRCLVFENYQHGNFMICGDFNARIGSLSDCPDNSSIPNKKPVDHTTNSFGRLLVDFLQTLDMCTLNGRFDPLKDGFTSVSTKGLAVVDYCLVTLQHFSAFSKFHVVDIHDFVHSKNIAVDSKIPDHRLITWKVIFNKLCQTVTLKLPIK